MRNIKKTAKLYPKIMLKNSCKQAYITTLPVRARKLEKISLVIF